MEEGIEAHDPADSVWDRKSKQSIQDLMPAGVSAFSHGEPDMKLRLDVLHPEYEEETGHDKELDTAFGQPRVTDGWRTRILQLVAKRRSNQEVV